MVKSMRKAYNKAVEADKENFIWDGKDFHTGYAKYLLEHLDSIFKHTQRK